MPNLAISHLTFGKADGGTTRLKCCVWPTLKQCAPDWHLRLRDRVHRWIAANPKAINNEEDERVNLQFRHDATPTAVAISSSRSAWSDAPPINSPLRLSSPVALKKPAALFPSTLPPYKTRSDDDEESERSARATAAATCGLAAWPLPIAQIGS
jgi:hypothetical protein